MKTAKDLIIPFSWSERRPVLLERFFYVPAKYMHAKKEFLFFDHPSPLHIEFCSGNGQWIAERAKKFPHINWLAVEKRFDRARKIWLKSFAQNLSNLSVICSEGLLFTRYYAPKAQEIFINFPDPWPKRRHAPHRIVREEFLKAIGEITDSGAKLTCVTDDPAYASGILKEFDKFPDWKCLFNKRDLPDYGDSFFKELWSRSKRDIHYISFEKL